MNKEISLKPRTVVRFKNGVRINHYATPTPFDSNRAREIYATRSFMGSEMEMSLGEEAYIHAVWDTIPSGSSSFMTAFYRILNNKVDAPK